ncbi:MAG TPA: hypothetical protein VLV78_03820 [Thermoanaerobaculia bacterium]|nr:hypothetical protein [Thermoanaerobaculia bacterium]
MPALRPFLVSKAIIAPAASARSSAIVVAALVAVAICTWMVTSS